MAKNEKTLFEKVIASGGLRPVIGVIEKHITQLLNYCADYIEENNIPADTSDIDALRQTFYPKPIGELSAITPNQVNLIAEAYFRGKGVIK